MVGRGLRVGAGAAALLASLAGTPALVAQEPGPGDWTVERSDHEVALPAGAGVEIENPWGDVRVRVGDEQRLTVHAVIQRRAAAAARDPVEARVEGGLGSIRVSDPEESRGVSADGPRPRIDLAVEVPRDAPLAVRTDRGLIEVKGHAGKLRAVSVAGDVRLWRQGPVEARTDRGAILAVFLDATRVGPSALETVTGGIEALFRPGVDADLRLETQGDLTTDYSLEVEPIGQLRKRGHARIGKGGVDVRLTSGHGALRVLRLLPESGGIADSD